MLRLGLVESGNVVDERVIKQRQTVTVGPSEKAHFVVAIDGIPGAFPLFELIGNDYYLNFLDSMSGRVALQTGVSELSMLKAQARRNAEGAYQVKLTDDTRGKIVIGPVSFLFQFVAPPPPQPKPRLPATATRGANGIDWVTTIIAAFSFLGHFLAIGMLYSDWLDPKADDEVRIASLVEAVRALPPPPPVETPDEGKKVADTQTDAPKAETKPSSGGNAGAQSSGPMSAAQAAAVAKEIDNMAAALLGSLAATGAATEGVLRSGDELATGALDQAARSGSGISGESIGGLNLQGGGGTIRPGESGGGLAAVGIAGKTAGTQGAGSGATVKGPSGNASVGGASVAGGAVSNASRVVAGMRAGFRACYQRELQNNPDAEGKISLVIRVGPGGEVTGVTANATGNLGGAVACVKSRAMAAQFDPPEGGSAAINVPVTFVKQ